MAAMTRDVGDGGDLLRLFLSKLQNPNQPTLSLD